MKSLYLVLFLSAFCFSFPCNAQDVKSGYVLEVRGDKVYLDLKERDIAIGNKVKVIKEGGFFTHPVTGEKIKEDDETIAILEIIDVRSNYSIATVFPREAISSIHQGQKVFKVEGDDLAAQNQSGIFKKSIAVQPLTVSNIQGYLGIYIGDVLTEQFLKIDMFKVLDRQTLGLQADQIVLSSGGVLTDAELLRYSSNKGADYYISGTMYEPDVVELSSGIPLKNIVSVVGGAAEAITGKNLGVSTIAEFVPERTEIKKLKAVVRITLRVIDVNTGEIKFMCTEMQEAVGESEINMEGGLLGGLKVRGGASSFLNTITGKATQVALTNLTNYILDYFNGKISEKTFTGNIIDIKALTSNNLSGINSGIKITSVTKKPEPFIPGFEEPDTTLLVTLNHGLDIRIKKRNYLIAYAPKLIGSKIDQTNLPSGLRQIGNVKVISSFDNSSEGILQLKNRYSSLNVNDYTQFSLRKKLAWHTIYAYCRITPSVPLGPGNLPGYGIGYMIYNKWGGYIDFGLPHEYMYGYMAVSLGGVKKIMNSTSVKAGVSILPMADEDNLVAFDLGGVSRIGYLSILYGTYWAEAGLGFSFGLGFTL